MKLINVRDAVGRALCHDMTQIIPGVFKGPRFKKGHVVTEGDIPVLLDMGKEQIYVWEPAPGMVHEEEGAEALRVLCQGSGLRAGQVSEGKIELFACCGGLLKIDTGRLAALNGIDGLMAATLRGNRGVREGDKVAAVKIIPLFVEQEKLDRARLVCGGEPLVRVLPYRSHRVGLVVTGNEVAQGRVPNAAPELIRQKLEPFSGEGALVTLDAVVTLEDKPEEITAQILAMIQGGMDVIFCTGGMSVDPDDRTPLGIKNTGARIAAYGVPLLPGAMTLVAYYRQGETQVPVLGLPACVLYSKITALDFFLPRLMAGDPISREDLALLGEGGLWSG